MCGIFFQVSRSSLKTPTWFPEPLSLHTENSLLEKIYSVELAEPQISGLIAEDLACRISLSDEDEHKIKTAERLRELQNSIKFLNNKKLSATEKEELDLFRRELAELTESKPLKAESEKNHNVSIDPGYALKSVLARGPDYAQMLAFEHKKNHFQLFSSVLSLRQPFTKQPLCTKEWILQFNGELYNPDCLSNDTAYIMTQIVNELHTSKNRSEAVSRVVDRLQGEFAYVLFDTLENRVYFGKDKIGKRSLLYTETPEKVSISSVYPHESGSFVECKGNVMYTVDLSTYKAESSKLNTPLYSRICQKNTDYNVEACVEDLHVRLRQSCLARQSTISPLHTAAKDARFGILFSGGLDCTVLAALLARNLAENSAEEDKKCFIDLLTVGFDNPRTGLSASNSPDRLLSEQSWYELTRLFHNSKVRFRLAQIDVSYAEWLAHRENVRKLIFPCATEMDLSIAIAFYFATRAHGCEMLEIKGDVSDMPWSQFQEKKVDWSIKTDLYTSRAKVLFSGLGADELFGGYSRHENIFHGLTENSTTEEINERYHELSSSLTHDIDVIYERNLGRDDRAMSTWGKELRYPYLDESLVRWVVEKVPSEFKVGFEWTTQTTKKGQKRVMQTNRKAILRKLAEKLGLKLASKELKRAIQFGAKSAKMEVGQQKSRGTDAL